MTRMILVISSIIARVVREFLPCSTISPCDNPDGVRRFLDCTVRVTRMIDVTGRMLQCLAINGVTIREMQDRGMASG